MAVLRNSPAAALQRTSARSPLLHFQSTWTTPSISSDCSLVERRTPQRRSTGLRSAGMRALSWLFRDRSRSPRSRAAELAITRSARSATRRRFHGGGGLYGSPPFPHTACEEQLPARSARPVAIPCAVD